MITNADLDKLLELSYAATPRPWGAADEHGLMPGATPAWCVSRMDGDKWLYDLAYMPQEDEEAQVNAEFIAAARNVFNDLILALKEERAKSESLHWTIHELTKGVGED